MKFTRNRYDELSRREPEHVSGFQPSQRLIQFLKEREGLSRQPDFDGYGTYTVGYGVNYPNRQAALAAIRRLGGTPGRLTDAQATPDLIRTIQKKEATIQGTLNERGRAVWNGLKDYQQDALRSLVYNLSERSSIPFLKKYINGNQVSRIPDALRLYTGSWSSGNNKGLAIRRELEREMFLGRNALGKGGQSIADTIQGSAGRRRNARRDRARYDDEGERPGRYRPGRYPAQSRHPKGKPGLGDADMEPPRYRGRPQRQPREVNMIPTQQPQYYQINGHGILVPYDAPSVGRSRHMRPSF